MSWKDLEEARPELAEFGLQRLNARVAYLATVRKDGSPRVHPVTPIIGQGHLFVFMEPTSPKGHDLRRDGRYALHSLVTDPNGSEGEFSLTGKGREVEDAAGRALAAQLSSYTPNDRYRLFELSVESSASTVYDGARTLRQHWKRDDTHDTR